MSTTSLLWSVQPPGGKLSYLFGTMHIKDDRVYQFCDALYPLILQSDVYVGEMNLDSMLSPEVGPRYEMKSFFRPNVYSKLRKQIVKSFKVDVDRYAHLHPLMIMSAVSHTILDNDHAVSLDEHLWNFAAERDITVQGLESIGEQMALMHSIDPQPLYVQLKNISARPEMIRRFTDSALHCYLHGEIHKLYKLTKSSMHQLRKRIIYQRNKVMAERIAGFDPTLSYFITAGAGHLSGPSGIISSLRKAAYTVKAVPFERALDDTLVLVR